MEAGKATNSLFGEGLIERGVIELALGFIAFCVIPACLAYAGSPEKASSEGLKKTDIANFVLAGSTFLIALFTFLAAWAARPIGQGDRKAGAGGTAE